MVALCSSYDLGPLYRVIPDCKQQAPALSRCGSNHLPGMTSISYNHCTCIVCCVALPSLSLIEMIRLLLLIVCRLCLYGSLFVVSFPSLHVHVQVDAGTSVPYRSQFEIFIRSSSNRNACSFLLTLASITAKSL